MIPFSACHIAVATNHALLHIPIFVLLNITVPSGLAFNTLCSYACIILYIIDYLSRVLVRKFFLVSGWHLIFSWQTTDSEEITVSIN